MATIRSYFKFRKASACLAVGLALAGCEEGAGNNLFDQFGADTSEESQSSASTTENSVIEQDVERADIFFVEDSGLWDGRPSLGGTWVAHADVKDPERAVIRNTDNGKSIVGALFRRERELPGPSIQVSSDAASALGMVAGQPANLSVTVLRREAVPVVVEEAPELEESVDLGEEDEIETTTLEDPIAAAAAAIDAVESEGEAEATSAAPEPRPAQTPALAKPFIQVAIFNIEENAESTAQSMREAGMIPTVKSGTLNDKPIWRIVLGPATTSEERTVLHDRVKELGFDDAYFVKN